MDIAVRYVMENVSNYAVQPIPKYFFYYLLIECRHQTGLLLALQTDKNHLGHGYAALVAKHVSKKIAESGFDIHAGVFEVNHPSRSLFQKLGYKTIGKVHWIMCNHNWCDADE